MARKSGLGKGLDALIPPGESAIPASGINRISIDSISPNPRQPRSKFNPEELEELAASIKEHGILQPVILAQGDKPGDYILIAGERRLQAARQAELLEVPAIIRDARDQTYLELALIENLQRTDLNPLEEAEAYRQLADDFDLSHEEIAQRVSKSRAAVTNTIRLLNLSSNVRKALLEDQISAGHARALLALTSRQAQNAALQTILARDLSVRQTEDLARKMKGKPKKKSKKVTAPPPEIAALEDRLRSYLGTKVRVTRSRNGGTLIIHYYSDEELNAIIEQIMGDDPG